jgi:hypothetical protein
MSRMATPPTMSASATTPVEKRRSLMKSRARKPIAGRRQERDEQVEHEPPVGRPHGVPQHVEEQRAIVPHHGEDGPELNEDVERLPALAAQPQPLGGDDEVPRGTIPG